jgi:hypothetical protein
MHSPSSLDYSVFYGLIQLKAVYTTNEILVVRHHATKARINANCVEVHHATRISQFV